MLAELKFVLGSVAKKDFLPTLTHFVIENSTVRGYNGTLALCSPIPFNIACKPKADPLVKAIANCTDTVALAITPAGRLSVRSGKFRALVECAPDEVTPHVLPSGMYAEIDGKALLEALKAVQPFIGEDAARQWCMGVLIRGNSVFATNNVILVEHWVGHSLLPEAINLPKPAVKEMLRIGEAPERVMVDTTSITFFYEGNRWLRTQLLSTEWPDLSKVLDSAGQPAPIDEKFFEGLDTIRPFVDKLGRVIFKPGLMQTHDNEGEGASYELASITNDAVYNLEMLRLLEGSATQMDLNQYPKPCPFYGEKLRGVVIGMRL